MAERLFSYTQGCKFNLKYIDVLKSGTLANLERENEHLEIEMEEDFPTCLLYPLHLL